MKKLILLFILLCFPVLSLAQAEVPIIAYPGALPGTCQPFTIGFTRFGGAMAGLYRCTAANVFAPIGSTGPFRQQYIAQGTLTANSPYISHTATWNAPGQTMDGIFSNVTDTASAVNSYLARFQVGAATQFSIRKDGFVSVSAGGEYGFTGRSQISSPADGIINLLNNAANGFVQLRLGPSAVSHPGITASPAIAGHAQGIILRRADDSNQVFANLGAAVNGTIIYCSDCGNGGVMIGNCVAAGTGAFAMRLNGVWRCAQ